MATFIFDYDSTIITCESLEEILFEHISETSKESNSIKELTRRGMEGEISFQDSLKGRLEICSPNHSQLIDYGNKAYKDLTVGMDDLILNLNKKHECWILSGGLQEAIIPLGTSLHIPIERIKGVSLLWDEKGDFKGINESDPFSHSKLKGAKTLSDKWKKPVIGIGDGMTDFSLYEAGYLDYFIAFTMNVTRHNLVQQEGIMIANDIIALRSCIEEILGESV